MTYTVDNFAALDREVQIAQDRRLLAELTASGASVPDASPAPLCPGVPAGSAFLPVAARLSAEDVAGALRTPVAEVA